MFLQGVRSLGGREARDRVIDPCEEPVAVRVSFDSTRRSLSALPYAAECTGSTPTDGFSFNRST